MTSPATESPSDTSQAVGGARVRKTKAILLTLVLVPLLGVGALEACFRLFVSVTDVPFVFWDPLIGMRRIPNQTGRLLAGQHIDARYHFNAQGWNSPEDFVTTRRPGTRRIAIIGDSQVEAIQVNTEQTMFSVAQHRMNRPDRPVQWYPFASTGLGTAEEHELLRHYVFDYRPDVVILFFVQNDPFDCSPYIMPIEPSRVQYYLGADDRLVLVPPAYSNPVTWRRWAAHSALVRYFMIQKRLIEKFKSLNNPLPDQFQTGGLPLRQLVESFTPSYLPNLKTVSLEERQRLTWRLIEKLLESSRDLCREHNCTFMIAYRGSMTAIDAPLSTTPPPTRPPADDPWCLGPRLQDMGPEQLEPIAKKLGIPYLDLAGPLRDRVAQTHRSHIFSDDGHYNAMAHEVAGQAMADWIEAYWAAHPETADHTPAAGPTVRAAGRSLPDVQP